MAGMLDWLLRAHMGGGSMLPIGAFPPVDDSGSPDDQGTLAERRIWGRRNRQSNQGFDEAGFPVDEGGSGSPIPFSVVPPGFDARERRGAHWRGPNEVPGGIGGPADWMSPPSQAPGWGEGAQPVPGVGAVADLLSPKASAPDLPPSTNDPMSGEPEVFANGVPLPRPKPVTSSSVQNGGAPFSLSPAAAGASAQGPAAAAPAGGGGIMGGLGSIISNILKPENAPLLLSLAGGFAGAPSLGTGMRRAFSGAVPAAMALQKDRTAQGSQQETYRALLSRGVPAQEAMAAIRSPELMKAVVAKYFETEKPISINNRLVERKPDGTYKLVADYSDEVDKLKLSPGYQWKNDAKTEQTFIPGGPADPKVKAENQRLSEPPKYEWVDPNDHSKGQRAIKGGGAEKVDANVAARLGVAKSFLKQLPEIRERVAKGDATGAWDGAKAFFGVGEAGEIRRQIQSGAEALLRNLTGAGMNMTEAQKYISRYELQPLDTVWTVQSKLKQLERELAYTIESVEKGRGGVSAKDGRIIFEDGPAQTGSLGIGQSRTIGGVTITREK